jgi:hypothetical protein
MTERRRYTKRQKVEAVVEAERTSMTAVSERTGIPVTTIDYWMDRPEFVDLRSKTREEMAEGSMLLAKLAQDAIAQKVRAGEVEPRDLAVIYGIAIDKGQLLAGHATSRSETKSLNEVLSDHERDALKSAIDAEIAARAEDNGRARADEAVAAVVNAAPAESGAA